jgi:hypothetical protein
LIHSKEILFLFEKAVKDYRLFIFVGVLLAIDTVLLSAWQILDPLKIFKNISQKQVKRKMNSFFFGYYIYISRQKMKILLFYGFMKNVDQIVDRFGLQCNRYIKVYSW